LPSTYRRIIITNSISSNQQRLKAALWYAIGGIVDEESLRLDVNATPQFIGALTELVWSQIGEFLKERNLETAFGLRRGGIGELEAGLSS
jgi:hypothetical protein